MIFDPEYAQPHGGKLKDGDYKMRRFEAQAMAAKAADAHHDTCMEHHGAIQGYSWHSTALNHSLINPGRSAQINHPSATAKLQALHKSLSTAIQSAPAAHADMHVYSGISENHANSILARHQEGDTLTTKAYTSASFNPEVAAKFAGTVGGSSTGRNQGARQTVLHVKIKKGQTGFIHAEHASLHPNERETIMAPGRKLRINKVYDDPTSARRIISCELQD